MLALNFRRNALAARVDARLGDRAPAAERVDDEIAGIGEAANQLLVQFHFLSIRVKRLIGAIGGEYIFAAGAELVIISRPGNRLVVDQEGTATGCKTEQRMAGGRPVEHDSPFPPPFQAMALHLSQNLW